MIGKLEDFSIFPLRTFSKVSVVLDVISILVSDVLLDLAYALTQDSKTTRDGIVLHKFD